MSEENCERCHVWPVAYDSPRKWCKTCWDAWFRGDFDLPEDSATPRRATEETKP